MVLTNRQRNEADAEKAEQLAASIKESNDGLRHSMGELDKAGRETLDSLKQALTRMKGDLTKAQSELMNKHQARVREVDVAAIARLEAQLKTQQMKLKFVRTQNEEQGNKVAEAKGAIRKLEAAIAEKACAALNKKPDHGFHLMTKEQVVWSDKLQASHRFHHAAHINALCL